MGKQLDSIASVPCRKTFSGISLNKSLFSQNLVVWVTSPGMQSSTNLNCTSKSSEFFKFRTEQRFYRTLRNLQNPHLHRRFVDNTLQTLSNFILIYIKKIIYIKEIRDLSRGWKQWWNSILHFHLFEFCLFRVFSQMSEIKDWIQGKWF